jgi:hypothetical protein
MPALREVPPTRLSLLFLIAFSVAPLAAQAPAPKPDTPKPENLLTLEGCAAGMALKSTTLVEPDATGTLVTGATYRMTGSKDLKAQIKKLSGSLVRVTGTVSNAPNTAPKGKKFGKTTVSIGTPSDPMSPSPSRMPDTPTIDVQSVSAIDVKCSR